MAVDPEPREMLGLPAFGFEDPGPLRDELTTAVLAGRKIATASLVADYVIDGEALPTPGQRSVIYDSDRRPVGVIETIRIQLATMGTVADGFARDEGEGFADSSDWRVAHERFWGRHLDGYRAGLRDPGFTLTDSTPVVCEWFRLVARIDPVSGVVTPIDDAAGRNHLDAPRRAFVAAARTATLATTAPNGRPRLVPVCFVVGDDAIDGRPRLYSPLDEKPKASDDPHELGRVRDLLVLPQATLMVDRWSEDWSHLAWVRLDCRAELVEPASPEAAEHAAAIAALRAKYPQYAGHRLEDRPVIRLTVDRVVAWGDLAGE